MKWLKWILFAVLMLVIVLAAGVALFLVTFDANAYKDKIVAQVRHATGRELKLDGDIQTSFFPWLGFRLDKASLSNAKGFDDAYFFKLETAEVHIGLMSVFRQKPVISLISLEGLELNLARNKAGVSNWDDLISAEPAPAAAKPGPSDAQTSGTSTAESGAAMLAALRVKGLDLTQVRVHWKDATNGTQLSIDPMNLSIGAFAFGRPTSVQGDLHLAMNEPPMAADLSAQAQVTLDLNARVYTVKGLKLELKTQGKAIPGGTQQLTLSTDLVADLTANTAQAQPLRLQLSGVTVDGHLKATALDTAPQITGSFKSQTFSARELIKKLGVAPLQSADPGVLSKLNFAFDVNATRDSARLDKFKLVLDDSVMDGSASIKNFSAPAIRFDMALNAIDLDRYLPPVPEPVAKPSEDSAKPKTPATDDPIALPMQALRTLDLRGGLSVGRLVIRKLQMSDIKLTVSADKGVVKLAPVSLSMYEGKMLSNLSLDARQATPRYGIDFNLDGVAVGTPLQILAGDQYLSGKSQMQANLSTQGDRVSALKQGLAGNLKFTFTDGSFTHSKIGDSLVQAYTAIYSLQGKTADREKILHFNQMQGTAQVSKGIVSNQDLNGDMPFFLLKGEGQIDLTRDWIDNYTLSLAKLGDPNQPRDPAKPRQYLPILIKGPFEDPKVKLDTKAYLKSAAKKEFQDDVQKEKDKLEEKVKDKLGDKLKGLFK